MLRTKQYLGPFIIWSKTTRGLTSSKTNLGSLFVFLYMGLQPSLTSNLLSISRYLNYRTSPAKISHPFASSEVVFPPTLSGFPLITLPVTSFHGSCLGPLRDSELEGIITHFQQSGRIPLPREWASVGRKAKNEHKKEQPFLTLSLYIMAFADSENLGH